MIHKVVYNELKNDITDSNPVTVLNKLKRYSGLEDLTSLDGIEYHYQSLKTLLGDTSTTWYNNKIFYEKYNFNSSNWLAKKEDLPLIGISLSDPITRLNVSDGRAMRTMVRIDIKTDDMDTSSNQVHNIMMRIRSILEPEIANTAIYSKEGLCKTYINYSISTIHFSLTRISPLLADLASIYYSTTFTLI